MDIITSTSNQGIKNVKTMLAKAKARRQQQAFVVEGPRMVLETPEEFLREVYISQSYIEKSGETVQDFERRFGDKLRVVNDNVMKHMSDTETPQGILAVVTQPAYELSDLMADDKPLLMVLENVQDPGNLGTIFRTAEGAGVNGIIMSADTVDIFNPKTVRSTMGSLYRMPFVISSNLIETIDELQHQGVKFYAAHLAGEKYYDGYDYTGATGFLIGNEGNGLTDVIADKADEYVKIPMGGKLESLNAAMAAGVLMYEANRQRRI
jgi:TrmH family RNA methyltransferase